MHQAGRRAFLIGAGALLAGAGTADAQRSKKVYRIGVITTYVRSVARAREDFAGMAKELSRLGFDEGRNCVFEFRASYRDRSRLPAHAAELVALGVDVIVTDLPPATLAAKRATSTIPIVMRMGMEPKALGLVASLARPGGNVTGTLLQSAETTAKTIQLAREVLPAQTSIAMLYQPDYPGLEPYILHFEEVGMRSNLRTTRLPVRTEDDLDAALRRMSSERPGALLLVPTGVLGNSAERVLKFALDEHIVPIASTNWLVPEGALLALEANLRDLEVRTAAILAKVLTGVNPAEIPVEEPATFELWINLKTARALALVLPNSVRVRADRVFE